MITRLLIVVLAILLVAYLVPGITVDGFFVALIVAIILGLLNVTVKPILFILTLPVTILTLGLFTFVINAALFFFVSTFIEGFEVAGFVPALIGSILISIVSSVGSKWVGKK